MAGADYAFDISDPNVQAQCDVRFTDQVAATDLADFSIVEVTLGESLLTPGLQTSVRVQSFAHNQVVKNLDNFRKAGLQISLTRPILAIAGFEDTLDVDQVIYRIDKRKMINNVTEEFTIRACDPSLLNDAETLVSKSWKCESPSDIVRYVLGSCIGATSTDVEDSDPSRDYIAENIHPFQVIQQQANYALWGDDPSFLHYMTYKNGGTHHFRSLASLCGDYDEDNIPTFTYNESPNAYANPNSALTYSFPCDFDVLADILNGIDENGNNMSSVALFDPNLKSFSLMGNTDIGCGNGAGVFRYAITNQNSAEFTDSCPDYAKEYLLKRQARMGLLEPNRINLRLVVPFNASLHVGTVIRFIVYNKGAEDVINEDYNYGSGYYLILNMFHNYTLGGHATTVLDCVYQTVGVSGM